MVNAQPFSNLGLAQGINGGTLALIGAWNNSGTLVESGGAIYLGGNFTVANVGTVNQTNGAIYVTGTLTNTGTLTLASGPWVLNGGTIIGGSVTTMAGASLIVQGGTMDGVTMNGALDVGNSVNGASLTVTNGLVLNGTALVGNPTNNWYGQLVFAGTQSLSGSGTVVFGNNYYPYNALRLVNAGTALTLGMSITVRGQNGTIGSLAPFGGPQNVVVVNQGTISADVSGGTITVNAQPFSNLGLAQGINGGTLALIGAWNNSGTLVESGGAIYLGGNFTVANVGTVNQTNGAIYVTGTLTNTGTLTLASGPWVLNGGTILGGNVVASNGASLIVQGGTMDGVTMNGALDVGNSVNGASLTVTNGLVLNGTALVGNPTNQWWGRLQFSGTQTLGGSGAVVFGNANPGNPLNTLWVINGGTTLTLGPSLLVHGHSGQVGYSAYFGGPQNVSVINQGTISADVSGGTIIINAQPFSNLGLVESPAGTLNLASGIAPGGLGSMQSSNGVLGLSGFLTNDNQSIILAGTNNALTLLSGGTIHGGTVVATNGNSLIISSGSGTLDGVTVNGVLDAGNTYNGGGPNVTNGLTLNGTALVGNPTNGWWGTLWFYGSQTLSGNGTVVFGNQGSNPSYNSLRVVNAGTTLTIGPGITIRGQNGAIGYNSNWGGPQNVSVINQGTISADVANGTITINAQPFTNQGTVETPGGTLNVGHIENTGQTLVVGAEYSSLALSGGWIHGGSVVMTNDVRLVVGNLTLDGVTVNGNLDIGNQINGGILTVTNGLTLNGTAYVGTPWSGYYGSMAFAGNQSLAGDATVVFGANGNNALWLTLGGDHACACAWRHGARPKRVDWQRPEFGRACQSKHCEPRLHFCG